MNLHVSYFYFYIKVAHQRDIATLKIKCTTTNKRLIKKFIIFPFEQPSIWNSMKIHFID